MKSFVLVAIIVGSLIVAPRVASASDGYIGLEVMEGIGFSIPAGLAITNIVFSIHDLATAGTPASRSFARWEIGIAVPALLLGVGGCVYDGFDRNFVPTTTGISFTTIAVAALATSLPPLIHGIWTLSRSRTAPTRDLLVIPFAGGGREQLAGISLVGRF